HVAYTNSPLGKKVLEDWEKYAQRFTKVIPNDYKRMLENIEQAHKDGFEGDSALMAAFEMSLKQ
ncbi:MAG: hypothetical protein WCP73_06100, partial [Eubacteriales bacterium]